MYRGLTTFECTNCGHTFKSHNIEYKMTWLCVPQRCPQCGINGTESTYKPLWEEMEKIEKEKEEKRLRAKAKREAEEESQKKKQAKKRKHMSRGQKEKLAKQREKKAAKRNKRQQFTEPKKEETIILGATWFPPGTPLKIDEEL